MENPGMGAAGTAACRAARSAALAKSVVHGPGGGTGGPTGPKRGRVRKPTAGTAALWRKGGCIRRLFYATHPLRTPVGRRRGRWVA
jgi:hypothetical protein